MKGADDAAAAAAGSGGSLRLVIVASRAWLGARECAPSSSSLWNGFRSRLLLRAHGSLHIIRNGNLAQSHAARQGCKWVERQLL